MIGKPWLSPHPVELRFYYGYVVVAAAVLITVVMWGGAYSFGIFFKPLLAEFGWTRAMTSGAFSLAILMEGFGSIFTGRLTDRFGSRAVLSVCGLFFGVGYLLMSRIGSIWQLYLVYGVIVGIGLSGSYVSIMAAVANWFEKSRGLMSAVVVSSIGIGTLAMAPLANHLILTRGWRLSFMIVGGMALVAVLAAAQFFRPAPNPNESPQGHRPAGDGRNSRSEPAPIPFRTALRSGQLWLICCVLLFWGFSKYAILIHITPHAIDLGISPTNAAHILSIVGAVTFAATLILGVTADKIGGYRALIMGLAIMSASLVWLLAARGLWSLYIFAVLFSFGYACGSVLMPAIIAEVFGMQSYGLLLGLVNFTACIGCASGPILTEDMFDITGRYQLAFTVVAALSLASLVLAVIIAKKVK